MRLANADPNSPRFFYAKIGRANELASVYLNGQGEIHQPSIPIYFDCSFDNERAFLDSGCAREQGEWFFECARNPSAKFVIVVHDGEVWIVAPCGPIQFSRSIIGYKENGGFVKLLPVRVIRRVRLADVPHVLASIGANRYYSSGTFREISAVGNVLAIKSLLGLPIPTPTNPSIGDAIECLSSVEFETLVARLLEERGFFVPAYRGGMMPGADLFAFNRSTGALSLGDLVVGPGKRVAIQVKLKAGRWTLPRGIDLMICAQRVVNPPTLGSNWLDVLLQDAPSTREWLKTSLDWLPRDFLRLTCD